MNYELLEDAKEIMEKVNGIDVAALMETMGDVKIDAKSRCASLVYLATYSDDTIYQLDIKPMETGVEIFAKNKYYVLPECFDEEECESKYTTDQIHTYLGGEKWLNLYKLLVKEMNALREIEDEYYDEYFLMFNSNDCDTVITSTTALAIFKEFVEGVGEEESDDVIFKLGYRNVYKMITNYIHDVVDVTE